jgi:aminopeptidase N
MFAKVAAFEFRYQLRQPVFWVVGILFFLMAFGWITIDNFHIGDTDNVHKNAPWALTQGYLIFANLYMFVTTAFVANVVIRDAETGYGPIIWSTPLSKFDYLYGRFLGAFAASVVSFLFIPLAIILGGMMPWLDPESLSPLRLDTHVWAFVIFAVPSLLFSAAAFFALATVTRSLMWTYVGVIVFLVLDSLTGIAAGKPGLEKLFAVIEPFGGGAFDLVTRYWTPAERNLQNVPLDGYVLANRLLALALSALLLALAYALFQSRGKAATAGKARKAERLAKAAAGPPPARPLGALPKGRFGFGAAWSQLMARTKLDFIQAFGSPVFPVLIGVGMVNAGFGMWLTIDEARYGGSFHPATSALIPVLTGAFSALIPPIIAVFYAGELVWREKDKKTNELIDAAPVPDWAFVVPKTLAVALVLVSALFFSVVLSVIFQAFHGYDNFEFSKFLLWYLLPQGLSLSLVAALAVFLQVVSPHKFVGWGLMVVYLISTLTLDQLGFDHKLYQFGGGPLGQLIPLSDMNGMGKFWIGAWWFRAYWTAITLVLLVLAHLLWRRGTETRLWPRFARLPRRLSRGVSGVLLAVLVVAAVGSGGFIYLNTNVWNQYRTRLDNDKWQADLEKDLKGFVGAPQPKVVAIRLNVDIHPHDPSVETKGSYVIENRTGAPLKEVQLLFGRDLKVTGLSIEGARPKKTYERYNFRVFTFDTPMAPGERRTITFTTLRSQHGFRNTGNEMRVVDNGTFLDSGDIAPGLGITDQAFLTDRAKRRKYKLQPAEIRPPKLGTPGADQFNYITHAADWVTSDITVTTDADQIPIAPGYTVSDTVQDGRRTVHFVTDREILPFVSVQSARYAVKTDRYKGIDLAVYYDPQHPYNVDRMIASMKLSLDYYQANFSPYQFHHMRFLEFPNYAQFAQSFAGTVPWSEGLFFIADNRDPEKIDMVTYVGAHEIGHQWWAHQVIGADEQGSTVLSETLAQYSALMVMKHRYGPDMIGKFLKFELDSYLSNRGGEALEELPLAQVENQGYIHYRKGSLVMYRLQDEIGEEAVNRALRSLLQKFAFKGAPYPTSNDLIAALRAEAPADKQQLITDLFQKITLYDVKTKSMKVKKRADGRFDVTLTVEAKKLYADSKGKESAAPLDEQFDVGLFTAKPGKKDYGPSSVILLEKRPVKSGVQTLTFVTSKAPVWGGVDPLNKLIDRNSDDNVAKAG